MKNLTKLSLVAVALTSTLAVSQSALAEVSANAGVTSNYLWRGVSQSADSASVSGGIDYANESGFYAGTWVGSLGEGSGSETDFYLGFGGEADSFTYDIGFIQYHYSDLEDGDFGEVYFNGGFGNFGFGLAYTAISQVEDGAFEEGDIYVSVSYGGIDLGNDFELSVTAGHYNFDADSDESDLNYNHYQIDIAKGDFAFGISKADGSGVADNDLKFVASWSASF